MLKQRKKAAPVKRVALSSTSKTGMEEVLSVVGDLVTMNFEDAGLRITGAQSAVLGPAAWER